MFKQQRKIRHKTYKRILSLFLFALLGLSTVLSIPVLSAPHNQENSVLISQESNGQILLTQGIKSYQSENYTEALTIWQEALLEFKSSEDLFNQGLVLSNISLAYQHLGEIEDAQRTIDQSFLILEKLKNSPNSRAYAEVSAKIFNTQARLKWTTGQLKEALETWQQAESYYRQANNTSGEIGSKINQVQVLHALGLNLLAQNQFQGKLHSELQDVISALENHRDPYLRTIGWLNLGKVLRKIGKLEVEKSNSLDNQELPDSSPKSEYGSLEALTKSLEAAEQLEKDQQLNNSSLKISVLLELGNTHRALAQKKQVFGKKNEAKEHLNEAYTCYQEVRDNAEDTQKIQGELNLLSLSVETANQTLDVPKLIEDIKGKITTLKASRSSVYHQLNFARSLTCLQPLGKTDSPFCAHIPQEKDKQLNPEQLPAKTEIIQIITHAIDQAQQIEDLKAQSYAMGQLGGLYELNQQWDKAQRITQEAIKLLQKLNFHTTPGVSSSLSEKPINSRQNNNVLELRYLWEWQLGRLLRKKGDNHRAISAYKSAVQDLSLVNKDLTYLDSNTQFAFQESVEPVYRQLIDLLLPKNPKTVEKSTDLDTLGKSKSRLAQAQEQIKYLLQAELESFVQCSLDGINDDYGLEVEQLADYEGSKTALIYPILLEKRIGILLRLPNSEELIAYSIELPEQEYLEQILENLDKYLPRTGAKKKVQASAKDLYEVLIAPLEEELQANQIDTLVFLLDAPFRNIPISVLYDGEKYLIEKYAVAITSGLKSLEPQALTSVNFGAALAGLSESRQGFNATPEVESSFEQVQGEFNGSSVILNQEFTEENLTSLLGSLSFPVVHIATHGKFSSQPEETFLLTWNNKVDVNQLKNILHRGERSKTEPIELLVLAACETARGDKRAALGLAGVAVMSGARSTLATLWKIPADGSSGNLVIKFYQQLKDHPERTKAQALQHAQLEFLQNKELDSPYFWTPYVLVGNWR